MDYHGGRPVGHNRAFARGVLIFSNNERPGVEPRFRLYRAPAKLIASDRMQQITQKSFAILLPALAEMVEEQHLSCDAAMTRLREWIAPAVPSREIQDALRRLDDSPEESFVHNLGQECLKALRAPEM